MSSGLDTDGSHEDDTVACPDGRPQAGRIEEAIGRCLGKYVITGVLGRGGMGVVYRAMDRDLEREVALKVLSPELLHDEEGTRQESERLLREARAQAQLSHPNVVSIFDVGREGDEVYLAMELVPGPDLRAWLRERPRSWREVVSVFVGAGRGLQAAHAVGLVHRDFKPANVLMGQEGRARVTDFGLARMVREPSRDEPEADFGEDSGLVDDDELTVEGTVVGTPAYMAPEQHAGRPLSPAADQYALCVALWEALTGARPFGGTGLAELMRAKLHGPPEPPARSEVPPAVWRALRRGLMPSPEERFASMEPLLQALRGSATGRRWWVAGLVAVVATAGVAGLVWPTESASVCPGDGEALAGRWDEGARDELRRAFAATGRSDYGPTLARTEQALDDYAAAWLGERRDACEATRVRGEQDEATMDRRMVCLDRAGEALRRVVTALARIDAGTMDRAAQVVDTLPELDACAVSALEAVPSTPEEEALRAELVELDVELAAGRFEAALGLAEILGPRVQALGRPALVAKLGMVQAKALEGLARHVEAHEHLQRALEAAHEARDDRAVARLAVVLAWNVGIHQSRTREGLGWVRTAEAALERAGDEPSLRAEVLNARGVLSMDLGELDAAAEAFGAAIATVEEHLGDDDLRMAGVLVNLAILEGQRGDHQRAEILQRRALAIRERWQGRDHPDTAAVLNNLSTTLVSLGRDEEALAANEEALARIRRVHGDEHPLVGTMLVARGVLLYEQKRRGEAVAQLREAARVIDRALGSDHRNLAVVYNDIGYVLLEDGKPEPARWEFDRALAVVRMNGAYEQASTVPVLVGLAWALGDSGQLEAARERWDEVLARVDAGQGDGIDDLPAQLRRAAAIYERTGDPERAAALQARAEASGRASAAAQP
ncbi:MAG: serine/threonine protein kinase [Myxococcales bacterium]|nr:serine/threonine protein kinase [Myxococcales bacterium]